MKRHVLYNHLAAISVASIINYILTYAWHALNRFFKTGIRSDKPVLLSTSLATFNSEIQFGSEIFQYFNISLLFDFGRMKICSSNIVMFIKKKI